MMEDAKKLDGTYDPVGFVGSFAHQFRLLWASRRPLFLGIGLVGLLAVAGEPWSANPTARLVTLWPLWVILIGPVWALAVWHNEGPSARHYFWAQPSGRLTHTMARVAAGAAWLWILYALLIGAAAVLGAVDGEAWQLGHITAAGWVNFFTGPLLGYLMVSALAIPSDYPLRWILGIMLLVPLTISLLDRWLGLEWFVRAMFRPLGDPAWGLGPAMIGAWAEAALRVNHLVQHLEGDAPRLGTSFTLGSWALATVAWLAFWTGVVAVLAGLHPDRVPRPRRSGRSSG